MENNLIYNFIEEELKNRPNQIKDELNKKLNYKKEFYELKECLDDFLEGHDTDRFISLTGLRGTGKTTILYQLYTYIQNKENISPNQILYISGDILNYLTNVDILKVIEYFIKYVHKKTLLSLDKKLFILIDEAHYDKNWSLHGKIIFDKTKKIFMVFTGSSALNLEMNVDASRRIYNISIDALDYKEYLSLKYNVSLNKTQSLEDLIFTGDVEKSINLENEINSKILNCPKIKVDEWEEYLKYGGFPVSFNEKNHYRICKKLNDMVNKIIEKDLDSVENMSSSSKTYSSRLIRFLSLQKPGEVSKNKLANILNASNGTVQNILVALEKTHLIFHIEPLSSASKRVRKSWKYYFATASLRHNLAKNYGNPYRDINAYYGILAENLVASKLYNLSKNGKFDLYYDSNKGGVDFLIENGTLDIIPIEVGFGKKSKKQISKAISNYKSDYGIIISNTTQNIKKEDNIIYLPLKTFSLL